MAPSLDLRPVIPDGVVRRAFAERTVVLDLRSGRYFGLNPTAERMYAALETADSVRAALADLRTAYTPPPAGLEADLVALCERLAGLGLLELRAAG